MTSFKNHDSWLDRELYPFQHKYLTLKNGTMHYVDEGQGPILLFVHGTPTWSFLYRDLIKELSSRFRCIAIDHLGFGLSESPAKFSGKPEDHASNLVEFMTRLDLKDVSMVVHDFGGPIGLGAALTQPNRISNIVLFNTWLWATNQNPNALKIDKLINGWLGRTLYLNFNFSAKVLLKKGFSDAGRLSRNVHQHYIKPFPDKASRMSLLNIAKALVGSSDWYQSQWQELHHLEDKNWLIVWGTADEFITQEYLKTWQKRLPKAQVETLDCGHFVQEEKTGEVLQLMQKFLDKHV
ncbi:MAG: alpha/beta fold hydrolase [Bacteroidia bacterium]|nr:alpha/beta fold hydrolase [Bacteroidia bacterium]